MGSFRLKRGNPAGKQGERDIYFCNILSVILDACLPSVIYTDKSEVKFNKFSGLILES